MTFHIETMSLTEVTELFDRLVKADVPEPEVTTEQGFREEFIHTPDGPRRRIQHTPQNAPPPIRAATQDVVLAREALHEGLRACTAYFKAMARAAERCYPAEPPSAGDSK